jgi:hypothetical protein
VEVVTGVVGVLLTRERQVTIQTSDADLHGATR